MACAVTALDPDLVDGEAEILRHRSASASCATQVWMTSRSGACWPDPDGLAARRHASDVYLLSQLQLRIPQADGVVAGERPLVRRSDLARAVQLSAPIGRACITVGAFLAGAVIDSDWFNQKQMDQLRHNVLLVVMPVFF